MGNESISLSGTSGPSTWLFTGDGTFTSLCEDEAPVPLLLLNLIVYRNFYAVQYATQNDAADE